jgi:hypothetical protein
MTRKKYKPGAHPNSQANLTFHDGRPLAFGKQKKKRNLSVTEEGWEGLQPIIEELGCSSVSEFLEKVGRREVKVSA